LCEIRIQTPQVDNPAASGRTSACGIIQQATKIIGARRAKTIGILGPRQKTFPRLHRDASFSRAGNEPAQPIPDALAVCKNKPPSFGWRLAMVSRLFGLDTRSRRPLYFVEPILDFVFTRVRCIGNDSMQTQI